jgi:glycosyltransferase involved in cell wall biosynthesis
MTGSPDRDRLVTVVTITRNRPDRLLRAAASVAAQEGVHLQHVVVGDDCPALAGSFRAELHRRFPSLVSVNVGPVRDGRTEAYLPSRLGFLRNLGARVGTGKLIAQLDDDNVFRPDHLVTLVRALESRPEAQVAHSWRRLLTPDGQPFVPVDDPWHPDPARRADSYAYLASLGIFEPGSPVVRDTLMVRGRVIARVDTSEFLVRRGLHERLPWPTDFSRAQQKLGFTEDLVFSHRLVKQRVEVACSERPTLDYYMGGYSNPQGGNG